MDVGGLRQQLDTAAHQRLSQRSQSAKEAAGHLASRDAHEKAKVSELAEQFESLFLDIVFQSMRKTVPKSELFNGGNAEDIFRNMLDSEYAKIMAGQRTTGLAGTIEKDLLKAMENRVSTATRSEGQRVYAEQGLHIGDKKETISVERVLGEGY